MKLLSKRYHMPLYIRFAMAEGFLTRSIIIRVLGVQVPPP
ncbi:MAG: hypothetical protein ACI9O0_000762, partial [Paracoccaceae bacterium]